MAMAPFSFEGELLEPLQLARRIQVRMHGLHNMRRPINRLSTETIACIILEASPVASLLDTEAYIDTLTRWARLRTVCKAWCRAMDSTPEFWRHIWVHRGGHNVAHLQRLNVVEPLRCLITGWETDSLLCDETLQNSLTLISELRNELHSHDLDRWCQAWFSSTHGGHPNLTLLTMSGPPKPGYRSTRISHPATLETNGAPPTLVFDGLHVRTVDPNLFHWVQVLKIVNIDVGNSFVQDICKFIYTASNITELHLKTIKTLRRIFDHRLGLPKIPKYPGKNSPLRVVTFVGLDSSLSTELLNCLSSCRLKVLEVDTLEPKCLEDSMDQPSAIAKVLDFLLLTGEISLTVKRLAMHINFTKFGGLVMTGNDEGWKLESARIGFYTLSSDERTNLVKQLAALGIRALSDSVIFNTVMDRRYSTSLSYAKILVVERDGGQDDLREITSATQLTLGSTQYSCPLLEQLILMDSPVAPWYNTRPCWKLEKWWTFVTSHQDKASNAGSRIAKLKRLGLPSDVIKEIGHDKRSWLESQGIEVCDTGDNEFLLSLGS